uniref:Mediator of RNA polymerase II transcription subunit 10 n=1 Tax=Steinernema glaseri TaxID=37863 RepID=A0A1I7ZF30_9BILA
MEPLPDSERFVRLERTLEQLQENVRQLGVIASCFQPQSQEPFNQRLHTLISGLQELDALRNHFADVKVPLALLDCINEGRNPNVFDRETLKEVEARNAAVNGKIEVYKKFHALLLHEHGQEMPKEVEMYLQARPELFEGVDGVELKKLD